MTIRWLKDIQVKNRFLWFGIFRNAIEFHPTCQIPIKNHPIRPNWRNEKDRKRGFGTDSLYEIDTC